MACNSHVLTQYISPLKDSPNIPAPGKKKSQLLVQQNNMEQDLKCEAKASFSELELEVRRTENNTKFCCWGWGVGGREWMDLYSCFFLRKSEIVSCSVMSNSL